MTSTTRVTVTDRRKRTVIRAAHLFDPTTLSVIDEPVVLIDGHTIVAVDRAGEFGGLDKPNVVDLPGATLLPGLIDTHVHLCFDAGDDVASSLAGRDSSAVLSAMADAARIAVASGITTVRDLGDRGYLAVTLRGMRDAGLPTIVAAGPPITSIGGHCHFLGGAASGVVGIRAAVREHAERDVDVIKIMASGGHLTPGTRPDLPQFSRAVLLAATEEAHRFGLPVTAHAHGLSAIEDALAAGVDGLEHVTFHAAGGILAAPPDLVRAIADSGAALGLTLGIAPVPDAVMPAFIAANLPKIMANVGLLINSGALVVLGTDAGIGPNKPHDVLLHAIEQYVGFGPTPMQALQTVTTDAAEVIGLGHRKGRLAAGFDADILAVDGDPTNDLSALRRIRAVFARGVQVA